MPAAKKRSEPTKTSQGGGGLCPGLISFLVVLVSCLIGLAVFLRRDALPIDPALIEADGLRWVRLPDGRLLEYHTCGDLKGETFLMFHGYGGSATTFLPFCDLSSKYGLKQVSVSLPGFGLSDAYPVGKTRVIGDWPEDVKHILAAVGCTGDCKFYTAGLSFGGPHAAAVASKMANRVKGAALLTPVSPTSLDDQLKVYDDLAPATRIAKQILASPYAGDLLAFMLVRGMDARQRMNAAPDVLAAVDRLEEELGAVGAKIRKLFLEDGTRASNYTHRGWADNAVTLVNDWGFDVAAGEEVVRNGGKYIITTCPADRTNPPVMQKWFANTVKGSTLLTVDDAWGHLHPLVPKITEQIYASLFSERRS